MSTKFTDYATILQETGYDFITLPEYKLDDRHNSSSYILIRPSTMSAPVMRFKTANGRSGFAIRIVETELGRKTAKEIFKPRSGKYIDDAMVIQQRYTDSDECWITNFCHEMYEDAARAVINHYHDKSSGHKSIDVCDMCPLGNEARPHFLRELLTGVHPIVKLN